MPKQKNQSCKKSDIELSIGTLKLRQKDQCIKCRSFVVLADSPALLGMPDIELLSILRIMWHNR